MKIECDTIKDLLPSYIDKLLSDASNRLVEEHLNECKSCQETLKNMNSEIYAEIKEKKEKQIDYLKGYKKNKIKSIIFTILLTTCVLIGIFIILFILDQNIEFNYNINELGIDYRQSEEINGKNILTFDIYNIKNSFRLEEYKVIANDGTTSIYLKFIGKNPLIRDIEGTRTVYNFEIDEKVKNIYITDEKGNTREIWNNYKGALTPKVVNSDNYLK